MRPKCEREGRGGGSETGDPEYCGGGGVENEKEKEHGRGLFFWECLRCVRARVESTVRVLLYILLKNHNIVSYTRSFGATLVRIFPPS